MKKTLLATTISLSIVAQFLTSVNALDIKRIAGMNRYQTSVEISKMNYKSSKKVILASGKVFADALAGGQLSIALDAPILLTPSNKLDASVKKEVSRLSAKEVIILGGSGSVSNDIEKELGIKNISRIWGKNRYETAKKIMDITSKTGNFEEIVIVSGKNYPDALSAAGYIKKHKALMFLSDGNSRPTSNIKKVAIGGHGSLPLDGFNGNRIAGKNRYETSLLLAEKSYPRASEVVIASGESYADALSAVSICNKKNAPILLSEKNNIDNNILKFIKTNKSNVKIVGGEGSLSQSLTYKIDPSDSNSSNTTTNSSSGSSSNSSSIVNKPTPPETKIDKTNLSNTISQADKINTSQKTDDSKNELIKALQEAKKIIQKDKVNQTEIDNADKKLKNAIKNLKNKETTDFYVISIT